MAEGVLFIMPTLFLPERTESVKTTVWQLERACRRSKMPSRIVVVCNETVDAFTSWVPQTGRVTKRVSNERHSIARAVNLGLSELSGESYICVHHDDLKILDLTWITRFAEVYSDQTLKCGILGIRSHTDSYIRHVND